jgi:hypothetical protein
MRVAMAALVVSLGCTGCGAPGDKDGRAETGGADSGGDSGDSGGSDPGSACVYGATRSDETIDVYGEVDDVRGELPLAGVEVVDCETGAGGLSEEGGGWTVPSQDASYVTVLAQIEGALPARWLFDPRVEGVPDMPFRQDMIWEDVLGGITAEVGVTRDPEAVVVVIEAMDPDTRVDLADAVVATVPPAEAYLRISLEGSPELSDTTNGLHDVAALNVPAGGISIVVDAGPDRTCRVPDALVVPAGGLLALTAYCPLDAR